jgi:hypothetical protein
MLTTGRPVLWPSVIQYLVNIEREELVMFDISQSQSFPLFIL